MDKTAMMTAMKASISEVLEQMFFLPIDFAEDRETGDGNPAMDQALLVMLRFNGPFKGCFQLRLPIRLAESITVDFLGTSEDELQPALVEGTVMEMVNMISGSTLSAYDHTAVFDLGLPRPVTDDRSALSEPNGNERVGFWIKTMQGDIQFDLVVD